jgi:hypothetical protein
MWDLLQNISRTDSNTMVSISSALLSLIALVYTARTYILKSGIKVRGWVSFASSVDCDDHYPSSLVIENLKDKALVVFAIYVRIGYSYYIKIEDFNDNPLIIEPFAVYKKEYEPIIQYTLSMDRFKIDSLITNKKVKKQIFLSTTEGRIKVLQNRPHWNPIFLTFRNFATATVNINRLSYEGKDYGELIDYLVDIRFHNGEKQVLKLRKDDYQYKLYKNLSFTQKSLSSKKELSRYLMELKNKKLIKFKTLEIFEFSEYVKKEYSDFRQKTVEAVPIGFFRYFVLAKIATRIEKYRTNKMNRERNSTNKKTRV